MSAFFDFAARGACADSQPAPSFSPYVPKTCVADEKLLLIAIALIVMTNSGDKMLAMMLFYIMSA